MTEFSFTERTPLEKGFAEVFRREIVPFLESHEERRKAALRGALTAVAIAAGAALAGSLLSWAMDWWIGIFLAPLLGVLAAWVAFVFYRDRWSMGLTGEVLPVMCRFLGGMEHGGEGVDPAVFAALGVVPHHTRVETGDTVTGTLDELRFALSEVRLKSRRRSGKRRRTRTVFRGLLLRIDLAEEVPPIFFGRDRGSLANKLGETLSDHRRGRERVETGHPAFEALYEVYADDPEAARRFITPALAQGLLDIARAETGKERHLAAATEGKGFYLALPRKGDYLGIGSLFRSLTKAEEDFHQALADLALPRRIITALRGY